MQTDEQGRPILSLQDKIAALRECLEHNAKEDALGHLFDLVNCVAPNFIFKTGETTLFGIKELQERYGDPPTPIKERTLDNYILPPDACPYCGQSCRTALARQCFECGKDWHSREGLQDAIDEATRKKEEAVSNQNWEVASNWRDRVIAMKQQLRTQLQ